MPTSFYSAQQAAVSPRIGIEAVSPSVDGGLFPVNRVVGDTLTVGADIICDGHDLLAVALLWREAGMPQWQEVRMTLLGNDRWEASVKLTTLGVIEYTVEAWVDHFATYQDELQKKLAAGIDISLELREGAHWLEKAASRPEGSKLHAVLAELNSAPPEDRPKILLSDDTKAMMDAAAHRAFAVRADPPFTVEVDRLAARYANWYEVFPRSLSDDENRHGTWKDVIRHLPRIQKMGFTVLYFPPVHPIGQKNRKGKNNSLQAGPNDPGSPYAIGSEAGGHEALHPELGTLEEFEQLRQAAQDHGLELALDFAVQCSPDHPWLKQHPEWFAHRPDGTIKFAENPPKKYEDIVNIDFYGAGAVPAAWEALRDVVRIWAERGVKLFRVDNPHTKPMPFWQWMIASIRRDFPDTVFLAEAFTRPKVMYRLAKIGFGQSYTYFTWREGKEEFQDYLNELSRAPAKEFFRPHFFVNTPDINPTYLQNAKRGMYLVRAALAATLSGLWGVYNGFELCEGTPFKKGVEEYLDSEKYQLRAWDWDRAGNIVPEITQLNAIRRDNPALQSHVNIEFLPSDSEQVLYFEKRCDTGRNILLVAISLDPSEPQTVSLSLPRKRWNVGETQAVKGTNLLTGVAKTFEDLAETIILTPDQPYAIWRIQPGAMAEQAVS
jgi:starch synthase (maltosyl-transferring)